MKECFSMDFLLDGIRAVTPQQCVMYVVGALLIYLAIKKDYEPSLLLPMNFIFTLFVEKLFTSPTLVYSFVKVIYSSSI